MANELPQFLSLTALRSSKQMGRPHRMTINISEIVSLEETMYQLAVSDDEVSWVSGTSIGLRDCQTMLDVREDLDTIHTLIKWAMVDGDVKALLPYEHDLLQKYFEAVGEQLQSLGICDKEGKTPTPEKDVD